MLFDPAIFDDLIFDTGPDPGPIPRPVRRGVPINAYKQFKAVDSRGNAYYMAPTESGDFDGY